MVYVNDPTRLAKWVDPFINELYCASDRLLLNGSTPKNLLAMFVSRQLYMLIIVF